jgi:hypothetical protein
MRSAGGRGRYADAGITLVGLGLLLESIKCTAKTLFFLMEHVVARGKVSILQKNRKQGKIRIV